MIMGGDGDTNGNDGEVLLLSFGSRLSSIGPATNFVFLFPVLL